MSLLKKLAGETVIYGLSHVSGRFLNYLLVFFHTRVLVEQSDYGKIGELYAYVAFLIILFTYRMETGFFRFGKEEKNRSNAYSTAMIMLFITTPLLATILISNTENLIDLLQLPNKPEWIIYLVLIVAFDALAAVPKARLRLDGRPYWFMFVSLTNIFINIFLNIFFLWLCPLLIDNGHDWLNDYYQQNNYVSYIFLANLVASASTFFILIPFYIRQKWVFDKNIFKPLIPYILPLIVVGLASVMNEVLDRTLLPWLMEGTVEENRGETGVYNAVYKLAMLMTIFIQAFNYAAEPFFFKNSDRSDSKVLYGKVGQAFALVGSIIFLGIVLYLDLIVLLLGENYREGKHVVPILLLANFLLGMYYNFAIWYKLIDKTKIGMYIAIGGALITVLFNIILIPKMGYTGSAITTMICYLFMSVMAYRLGQKYYKIEYPIFKMMKYIFTALVLYAISITLIHIVDISDIIIYTMNTLIFILFIGLLYYWEKNDLVKEFINNKK